MLTWVSINKDSEMNRLYENSLKTIFKGASSGLGQGLNIALFEDGDIVGGITLDFFQNIAQDENLTKYWHVYLAQPGVRMRRLWCKASDRRRGIYHLFEAVLQLSPPESFLYGVLALPLNFALSRKDFFSKNLNQLDPLLPLDECSWERRDEASSDGLKLYYRYLQLGVMILGPASGSVEDQTVRLAMGMPLSHVKHESIVQELA